jgi:hypothetical protein
MSETSRPDETCAVADCDQPAVVTPRAPTAGDVVPAEAGELVPLCATHAEQADTPPDPPTV